MFANILNLVLTKQNTLSYSCYDLVTLLVIVLEIAIPDCAAIYR